jgi:hypothetical protein
VTRPSYQAVATNPGVTLFGTLMNQSATVASVQYLVSEKNALEALPTYPSDLPFILGEGNSLSRQGGPGLSNTFGAALWGVSANLLMAAHNIKRFHMHQGTNYRYQAWQPVNTTRVTIGTKAPYYGNVAVAAFLGDLTKKQDRPQVVNMPLEGITQAAYASFVHGKLSKIMLLNLQDYNSTAANNYTSDYPRGSRNFALQLPKSYQGKTASLQRLMANGSDAVSGVTFGGYSYNYELDSGKPVLLKNTTSGEKVKADRQGRLSVDLLDSSAVLLSFK